VSSVRLDASTPEIVAWSTVLPSYWDTVHVDLYWTNSGAGSGGVRIEVGFGQFADGELADGAQSGIKTATYTAPAERYLKVTRLTDSARSIDEDHMWAGYVYRLADNVADTLTNDIGVVGLLFTRAS